MDLSIIIAAYNAESTIERAVNSVLSQKTNFSYEIIIVSDGSTDNTNSILSRFESDPRIKVFYNENRGVGATRNFGLNKASGDYVIYLDSDDEFYPSVIQKSLFLAKENDYDLVLFDSEFVYDDGDTEPFLAMDFEYGGKVSASSYVLSTPGPCNKVMKRTLFTESGLNFPEKIWYEDLATIPALGAYARKDKIYYLKETLYGYHQSGTSIMRHEEYNPKFCDIIPAIKIIVSRLEKDFPAEAEYLACLHFYRSFAQIFYKYSKFDELHKMNEYFLSAFPKWKKNKYVRKSTLTIKLLIYLFSNEKYSLYKLLRKKK